MVKGMVDATWADKCSLYGILLTYFGASVFHTTKKIACATDSSMGNECIASSKAAEVIDYAREVLRALGILIDGPTTLYTDNKANLIVASKIGSASRARHLLRRYVGIQQRIAAFELVLGKVDDSENPSDYLTKWTSSKKARASDRYATNSDAYISG